MSPLSRRSRHRCVHVESLEQRQLLVTDVQLVADLNLAPARSVAPPRELVDVGGVAFLAGTTSTTGQELFRSDGTVGGTRIVKDIRVGTRSSAPRELTNVGGTLYFVANDGISGLELWRSDGTEQGTVLVKDLRAGPGGSYPSDVTNVGGTLYFAAEDGLRGRRLWKSDGTAEGTVPVSNAARSPTQLTALGDDLVFAASTATEQASLWMSDGTSTGTQVLRAYDTNTTGLYQFTISGGEVFFEVRGGEHEGLWKTDGSSAGTEYLKELDIADRGDPVTFTDYNGSLFFSLEASGHDELWKSDGTPAGTEKVREFATLPVELTVVGSTLYFAEGRALWKTDGTSAQTSIVATNLSPADLVSFNGKLYFQGRSRLTGAELFTSDGTPGGTVLVKDLNPEATPGPSGPVPASSRPENLTVAGEKLFFAATHAHEGRELWVSNGTGPGTELTQIAKGSASSSPRNLIDLGNAVLLEAQGKVWRTIGTSAGTTEINGLAGLSGESFRLGDTVFFAADGPEGRELWKSQAGQIELVKDIYPQGPYDPMNYSASPQNFANIGGTLLFAARTQNEGVELWKSDGTAEGTTLVKDIAPGRVGYLPNSSSPDHLVNLNGTLFFTAGDSATGIELWTSDGTAEGTTLFRDLRPGVLSSDPRDLVVIGGRLFFTARTGKGRELWTTDGTASGTRLVKDILPGAGGSSPALLTAAGNTLFFRANDGASGAELWRSDGTEEGTFLVRDIRPGDAGSGPSKLTVMNGNLFFTANNGANGVELWRSNGTEAGTDLLRDLIAGPTGSAPHDLVVLNDVLFFAATDHTSGQELFKTDGTRLGTMLAADIATPGGSTPLHLTRAAGTLYFTANDGVHGIELLRLDNALPVLGGISGSIGYTLNGPAVALAPLATVSDADNSDFAGGRLVVEITSGADPGNRVYIGGSAFSQSGTTLQRDGVTIGRVNAQGGVGLNRLEISFTAEATPAIARQLLRALRFRTDGATITDPRVISFTLTDGDGGISDTLTKTVNIV